MKKTITSREITQYSDKCPECKQEIKGFSESQVNFNLVVHRMRKHEKKK